MVENTTESVNEVFKEYEIFSNVSRIKINYTKSEIMPLRNVEHLVTVEAFCYGKRIRLEQVGSIKICGVVFSNNEALAYKENVLDKIEIFKAKMQAWQFRGLSLAGKILVTKTFGISQLIYTMQVCEYKERELESIERFIFGYLWSKNLSLGRAPDRIKRSILKQDYDKGGLKVPDIRDLNSALKLKQFLKASTANHVIKSIQKWEMESLNYNYVIQQEYARLCAFDNVTKVSQEAINYMSDKMRSEIKLDNIQQLTLDLLASIEVREFLTRKNNLLIKNFHFPLYSCGVKRLKHVINESRFPRSDRFALLARNVLSAFPKEWIELVSNNECNSEVDTRNLPEIGVVTKIGVKQIKVKNIRMILLEPPGVNPFTFEVKLGIAKIGDMNPFLTNRAANKSEHLRIIKYRFLHCDIFCKQRMFKFKMVENDKCDHCDQVETIKHLVWDCARSARAWALVNLILRDCGIPNEIDYIGLFTGFSPANMIVEAIATKIIQLIFQIDRRNNINEQKIKSEMIFIGDMHKHSEHHNIWLEIIERCKM